MARHLQTAPLATSTRSALDTILHSQSHNMLNTIILYTILYKIIVYQWLPAHQLADAFSCIYQYFSSFVFLDFPVTCAQLALGQLTGSRRMVPQQAHTNRVGEQKVSTSNKLIHSFMGEMKKSAYYSIKYMSILSKHTTHCSSLWCAMNMDDAVNSIPWVTSVDCVGNRLSAIGR